MGFNSGFKGLKSPKISCPLLVNPHIYFVSQRQSMAVTGHLTGHNTLRRYLHLMGLSDSPLCRRYGAEDETSAHFLCECEALASHKHVYLGSFFLESENIKIVSLGAI